MSDTPYQPTDEVDDEGPHSKRPSVTMFAAAVFVLVGVSTLASGAILEGAGVLLVAACCSLVGVNPSRRGR